MSKISTAYDALLIRLSTIFPSKTRIPNGYSMGDNPYIFLKDGYGLAIGSSEFSESEFCSYSYSTTFTVSLTREVLKTDSQFAQTDSVVKSMLEDLKTLQSDILKYDQLGQESSIEKIDFNGTNGIQFLEGEKSNFLILEVNFSVQITEYFT